MDTPECIIPNGFNALSQRLHHFIGFTLIALRNMQAQIIALQRAAEGCSDVSDALHDVAKQHQDLISSALLELSKMVDGYEAGAAAHASDAESSHLSEVMRWFLTGSGKAILD